MTHDMPDLDVYHVHNKHHGDITMKRRVIITIDGETHDLLREAAARIKSTSLNAWIVPTLVAAARATIGETYTFEANGAADELPDK
jgi:uncharacterized protein (DUF1778 family)